MVSLKLLKMMLPVIFLTGVSSCKSPPKDFPEIPQPNLKQVIIDQKYCDKDGLNCVVESSCKEWAVNDQGQWTLVEKHPLKFCHGNLGVTAPELTEIRDFIRKVKQWVKDHE